MEQIKNKHGEVLKIDDWCTTTNYFCIIGKLKEVTQDGKTVTLENISPYGTDIVWDVNYITIAKTPYHTAYNTSHGFGSANNDKTQGSYPYFKSMIDKGYL